MADGSVRFISETIDSGNIALAEPAEQPVGSPWAVTSPYGVWAPWVRVAGGETVSARRIGAARRGSPSKMSVVPLT